MDIEYRETIPDQQQFYDLFITTGWNDTYHLHAEQLGRALKSSWYAISAYAGEQLVGFGRAISDGILHALIVEMIVLPEYQGQGIGSHILESILSRCRENEIRDIQLFCARGKTGFYCKHGFVPRPDEGPGMQFQPLED